MKLLVNEIFYALEGESTRAGFPAVFIRLTGCNLQCSYCDTRYAREAGKILTMEQIIAYVSECAQCDHVTVTGGEPLMQGNAIGLLEVLVENGYDVQLETNGSFDLAPVPAGIRKIADVKTPSSSEGESFLWDNIAYLGQHDEVKFVIADMDDYRFAKETIQEHMQKLSSVISFSPVFGTMDPGILAGLIISDKLPVRLNVQLHKVLWPETEECKTVLFHA